MSGRASRSEFWLWYLFALVSVVALVLVAAPGAAGSGTSGFAATGVVLLSLWSVVLIVPSFTVTIRRLHDRNRSGWWVLLNALPYVGSVVFLVANSLDGSPGPNRYGPRPGGNLPSYRPDGSLIGVAESDARRMDENQ